MSDYTVLADFFTDASLPRHGRNALPEAPVQPHVERRFRLLAVAPALRSRFAPSAARLNPAECAPAA